MPKASSTPANLERHPDTGVERFAATWTGHRTSHHAHPEYQVTISDAGIGRFDYLGGTAEMPPGCLAVFHAGRPHVLACARRGQPWRLRSFHIPARWVEPDGAPLLQPAPLLGEGGLGQAFEAVWSAFPDGDLPRALERLASALRRRPGLEPTDRGQAALVRRCLDHLASTIDRPVSGGELARIAGTTPAVLRRAFVAATGLPPNAWHLQRRIDEAKYRVRLGTPLAEVAFACGFADQAHLTRHFTRLVGVSPMRYAAGARSGR